MKLKDLIQKIEAQYPPILAEPWDQVGIHFGSEQNTVAKVMVALDLRPEGVREAIKKQVDTLILHHPPIFEPIQRFNTDDPQIRMYEEVIKAGINVYAMHTNYDIAEGGMNDLLCEQLGLINTRPLQSEADAENPGIGRIGDFPQPSSRETVIEQVKAKFELDHVITIEQSPQEVYQRVAIIGGSGSGLMESVVQQDVDVFITGDITYHKAHDLYEYELLTIDAGHYIEHIFIQAMTDFLQKLSLPIEIISSTTNTNPFAIE